MDGRSKAIERGDGQWAVSPGRSPGPVWSCLPGVSYPEWCLVRAAGIIRAGPG